MATYVFRSNVSVNPPPGVTLPTLGPYGIAPPDLAAYFGGVSDAGYSITASEISAFSAFRKSLADQSLWDKVLEIYPLFGTAESLRVKMKAASGAGTLLLPHNGWSSAQTEMVNGRVIGKAQTTYNNTTAPCLRTGLKIGDLQQSFGVLAHVGGVTPVSGYSNNQLFGATQMEDASASTGMTTRIRNTGANGIAMENGYAAGSTTAGVVEYPVSQARMILGRTISGGFAGKPGVAEAEVSKTGFATNSTAGQDLELYLFSRNGFGANAAVQPSFVPACRLVIITRGITAAEGAALVDAAHALQTALGRQF